MREAWPAVPALAVASVPASADGLRSARISMHTPRACQHTPCPSSRFTAGGPLGEPFLYSHCSGVYHNRNALDAPTTAGAQSHLPAAYAVVRAMLEPEVADKTWHMLSQPGGPNVQKFNHCKEAFATRHAKLVEGVVSMKEAFGRYLELPTEEIQRVGLHDVRCVKFVAGQELPWHRPDPRVHFCAMVLLSDREGLGGGMMYMHPGECATDGDAMPLRMAQGDAVVCCAPRLDYAMARIEEGEVFLAVFEFALEEGGKGVPPPSPSTAA